MYFQLKNLLYLLAITVLLSSCSGFEKVRKSSDVNYKLSKANEYFDKKDYQHANMLYRELMPIMKSTRNYETLIYRYSFTFFYLKDYIEASYYFKSFVEYFPTSKEAEECEFMAAVSLYKYAPKFTLDQTNSMKAVESFQSYLVRYPKSPRVAEGTKYLDDLRRKLEMKEADAAKLYYNVYQYRAASVAYKSVLRDYPESPSADLYQFMIMKAMFKYAEASVLGKQEERYASAADAYRELKDGYPSSPYIAEAEKLNNEINNNVKKLRYEYK
jgi:outer membrane protein assembly factor BamD